MHSRPTRQLLPRRSSGGRLASKTTLLAVILTSLLTGCQAAFFGGLNAVTRKAPDIVLHTVAFAPHEKLSLDIYTPHSAIDAPVIVFFYGGSWMSGKRQWYRWLGQTLAHHGLVVVTPDYRKWPEVRMDGFMHDASHAVAWTYAHVADYGGNPRALFVMGHSAGAHIGALLSTDPHWLADVGMRPRQLSGFIGLAGPYDFLPLTNPKFVDMFGRTLQAQQRSQPIHFVDGDEPPMLLLQGTDDRIVGVRNTESLTRAMQEQGESVEMKLYPDIGHTAILLALAPSFDSKAPVLDDCLSFVHAYTANRSAETMIRSAHP